MRKLVVFGNGLGRALDNEYYDLAKALQTAWEDPATLDQTQRRLIFQCLPSELIEGNDLAAPKSELELESLQRVLAACDEIRRYEIDGGESWLSDTGKQFPHAIRSYIHRAASYFHMSPHVLSNSFCQPLVDWVLETRSHIATLNYDELLYRAFIGTRAFNGYDCLLDGFVGKFSGHNLMRRNTARQCFYLHLHWSPLYYSDANGDVRKSALADLPALKGYSSTHLVLTEVSHKMSVISASPVLSEYWRRLEEAIMESDGIILFGYGGGDVHLNSAIGRLFQDKTIEIVERRLPEYSENDGEQRRLEFWCKTLKSRKICAHWLDCILDFKNWKYEHNWG